MHRIGPLRLLARPLGALVRLGRRLRRDRRGNYSMIVAILLPVITGFVALGTESGLWLYDQQMEQTAADNAAFSAAVYYAGQGANATTATMTSAQIQAAAVAANYGFGGSVTTSTTCGSTFSGVTASSCSASNGLAACTVTGPSTGTSCVEVNYPPAGGPNAGAANCPPTSAANPCFIEVMVAQKPQQLFSALLLSNPVTIEARAVGEVTYSISETAAQGDACVLVTDTTSAAGGFTLVGNASVFAATCDLAINDPSTSNISEVGNASATFKNVYDAASSIASGSLTGNANLSGTQHFNTATINPYTLTNLPSLSSASAGPCGFTSVTGTLTSGSATITNVSSTAGIVVGMFATAPGYLSGASPNQSVVTAISGTSVTLATAAVASGTGKTIIFGVNNGAQAITSNTTLEPGFYTGINVTAQSLINMLPGTYYICPIPPTTTATGTTTALSSTVILPGSGPPSGWTNGMVISDSAGAIPANTIISSISVYGTLSQHASSTETSDTFSSSAATGTATGSILSATATANAIQFFTSPMPWVSGTITDSASPSGLQTGTTVTVNTDIVLGTTATASKTGDTFSVSGGGTFFSAGGATFYTAPFVNNSGTVGLPSACGTNPYTNATGCFTSGDGVTIVLLGSTASNPPTDCASISMAGSSVLDLVPPNAPGNPFNGIVITSTQNCAPAAVGATSGASTANIQGNGALNIFGAIDLGQYAVSFGGNGSNSSGCLQLIAHSLRLVGNGSLAQNCASVGTTNINETTTTGSTGTYSASLTN